MYLYFSSRNAPTPNTTSSTSCSCASLAQFDSIASQYDDQISMDEFVMGMGLLRRYLISFAKGRTLEVGCGTGRNMPFYKFGTDPSSAITTLTLADGAPAMLSVCSSKANNLPPPQPVIHLTTADTADLAAVPTGSVDTVISTFTICSYADPAAAMREMQVRTLATLACCSFDVDLSRAALPIRPPRDVSE